MGARSAVRRGVRVGGGPLEGRPAPHFELPDLDGRIHSLGEFRGRWLLLVFHRHLG